MSYKMRSYHFKGINYWLKAKLLASTDIGEYGQFWLGAESQVVTTCLNEFSSNEFSSGEPQ